MMRELFNEGRWDELEKRLKAALKEDPRDARSAFQLGNLLSLAARREEDRLREILGYYDVGLSQRWRAAICLNNKGVALARANKSRAALDSFRKALEESRRCGPAAYNLGILLERLSDDGLLRRMLLDLNLAVASTSPEDLIKERFKQAVEAGGWEEGNSPLDAPLYLWGEDLPSGFGFEPNVVEANVEEGNRYFSEGIAHLDSGQHQQAIHAFASAATFHPNLEAEIVPYRVRAQIALAQEFRRKARDLKAQGRFDDARAALETYHGLAASLPDRALAEELLLSEIDTLGEQLRNHEPASDWRELQALISMVRQRVEEADTRAGEESDGSVTAAPPENAAAGDTSETGPAEAAGTDGSEGSRAGAGNGNGQSGAGDASRAHSRSPLGDYIRGLCRDAWGQQIRFLIGIQAFDEADLMLDFSEVQWFALQDLSRWRRELFTSKVEALIARATEAATQEGGRSTAMAYLYQAREAAMEADDAHLQDRLDRQIKRLQSRPDKSEKITESEELLAKGEYLEVLRLTTNELAVDPEQSPLRSLRESALHRLKSRLEEALTARQWEGARQQAEDVLFLLPDDAGFRKLADRARHGQLAKLVSQGDNALAERRLEEARQHCQEALRINPVYHPALVLRRRIELADKVDPDAADEAFDQALVAFQKERAAAKPREAFQLLLPLRKLAPTALETDEAEEWTAVALVRLWTSELGQLQGEDDVQRLDEEIRQLLAIRPGDRQAEELREKLRRRSAKYGEERRRKGLEQLDAVQRHLLERDPIAALEVLLVVEEIGDSRFSADVESLRDEALGQIRRRAERLARETDRTPEIDQELQRLLKAYRHWAPPQQAEDLTGRLNRKQRQPERQRQARSDFKEIRDAVRKEANPLRALKLLHRRMVDLRRSGSEVPVMYHRELAAERHRLWGSMGRFQRLQAKLYEQYHQVERLFAAPAEKQESGDGED